MMTHHVDIYHCQRCGRISSREHEDEAPVCCGKEMSRAVANITYADESENVGPPDEVIEKSHHLEPSKRK
jgi:hypothetical protein